MRGGRVCGSVALLLVLLLLGPGCFGYRAVNVPLEQFDPTGGYRPTNVEDFRPSGDISIYLAFSGGGTRAAALAYGVMEELRDTQIVVDGKPTRLLDEVDTVSGVSGGSFPAAYYGLFGDRIFEDFEERFLRRNIQGAIIWRAFWPWNTIALMTPWLARSDIAKGIYHGSVFDQATFSDLKAARGAKVYINATDLSSGTRVTFTQGTFDMICSDLSELPIAYAVAASSAVPMLLSPVSFRSHAGECGYEMDPVLRAGLDERQTQPRRYRAIKSHIDLGDPEKRFLHLVDGGISDNLGLRAGLDLVEAVGGLRDTAEVFHTELPEHIVIISVNAETNPPSKIDLSSAAPGFAAMMNAVSGAQIRRYNFETLLLARDALELWGREASTADEKVETHMVEVSFENIFDEDERNELKNIKTSFVLSDDEVDHLRAAGRKLLRQSPDFQRLVTMLGGTPNQPL